MTDVGPLAFVCLVVTVVAVALPIREGACIELFAFAVYMVLLLGA